MKFFTSTVWRVVLSKRRIGTVSDMAEAEIRPILLPSSRKAWPNRQLGKFMVREGIIR